MTDRCRKGIMEEFHESSLDFNLKLGNQELKHPVFFLHKTLQPDTGNLKILADIGNFCGIRSVLFFCYHGSIKVFRSSNDERICYRTPFQTISLMNHSPKMPHLEYLFNKTKFFSGWFRK